MNQADILGGNVKVRGGLRLKPLKGEDDGSTEESRDNIPYTLCVRDWRCFVGGVKVSG